MRRPGPKPKPRPATAGRPPIPRPDHGGPESALRDVRGSCPRSRRGSDFADPDPRRGGAADLALLEAPAGKQDRAGGAAPGRGSARRFRPPDRNAARAKSKCINSAPAGRTHGNPRLSHKSRQGEEPDSQDRGSKEDGHQLEPEEQEQLQKAPRAQQVPRPEQAGAEKAQKVGQKARRGQAGSGATLQLAIAVRHRGALGFVGCARQLPPPRSGCGPAPGGGRCIPSLPRKRRAVGFAQGGIRHRVAGRRGPFTRLPARGCLRQIVGRVPESAKVPARLRPAGALARAR